MSTDTKGIPWKVRIYAGIGPNGRQRQLARQGTSPNARQKGKDMEAARVALRAEVDKAAAIRGTFGEMADEWLAHKKHTAAITTHYDTALRVARIKGELGHVKLDRLTARHLDQFYDRLLVGKPPKVKPVKAATVNHFHRIVHAILEQAYRWDQVPGNVADKARPPKTRSDGSHDLPNVDAMRALIDGIKNPSLKLAAELAANTGCRRGEILACCWSDIQGTQLRIARSLTQVPHTAMSVKAPKGGRTRTITLPVDMLTALAAHRVWLEKWATDRGQGLAADGPVFADMRTDLTGRTPHNPKWLTQAWANYCDRARVRCRFHDLRHFHATELIDRGLPVTMVSQRLGHAKVSMTTDTYAHALKPSDDRAAVVIGELMARNPSGGTVTA